MIEVNIHEAKTHLSRLLQRVAAGEEVLIGKAGKRVARIVPWHDGSKARVPGLDRGLFTVPDDFDDPLPADVIKGFEA
ncbi:MAG: type II toxin-antitoxin system Phd/YefM family antitoxin [Lentisphaerae bacterium]|nr:type II toxin-antitoxin system Phd/YefM family antitoxin [Lentisphaerota bacterium]